MILRCVLDDLLLPCEWDCKSPSLIVRDGDESFRLEAVEASFYELVAATDAERLRLQRCYRLLRVGSDFRVVVA